MTDITRSAVVSECGLYRYSLQRTWDANAPSVLFVMLNPSIADAERDDPTIRKCIGFARRWAFGGIVVGNLFAYRATDPKDLQRAHRGGTGIIGPENMQHLAQMVPRAQRIVVAWGAHAGPYDATIRTGARRA